MGNWVKIPGSLSLPCQDLEPEFLASTDRPTCSQGRPHHLFPEMGRESFSSLYTCLQTQDQGYFITQEHLWPALNIVPPNPLLFSTLSFRFLHMRCINWLLPAQRISPWLLGSSQTAEATNRAHQQKWQKWKSRTLNPLLCFPGSQQLMTRAVPIANLDGGLKYPNTSNAPQMQL